MEGVRAGTLKQNNINRRKRTQIAAESDVDEKTFDCETILSFYRPTSVWTQVWSFGFFCCVYFLCSNLFFYNIITKSKK